LGEGALPDNAAVGVLAQRATPKANERQGLSLAVYVRGASSRWNKARDRLRI